MWKPRIARSLMGDDIRNLHLCGARCGICGRIYFPYRRNCPQCLKEETVSEFRLSDHGKLHSFVVCTMAPPGYTVPHAQGYIDLDDGGGRIFSLLVDYGEEEHLSVGLEMELVIQAAGKDADGNDIVEYKFKPAGAEEGGKGS